MNYRGNSGLPVVMPVTPVAKRLMIVTVAVWLVGQILLEQVLKWVPVTSVLALTPGEVIADHYFWQPLTYMFLHAQEFSHILFNMLMLWWLGAELENLWGGKYFLFYYLLCGFGAGLLYCLIMGIYALGYQKSPVGLLTPIVGASGAIFGLLLAYGRIFGDRIVSFMMIFPMPAKYFVMLLGGIQFLSMVGSGPAGGEVSNLAHLLGLLSGYILLRVKDIQGRRKASKKRGRNLRLVVDNQKPEASEQKTGPKYWN